MAKTIEIDVKVDSKQAVKGVDELGKSTDKLAGSTDKLGKSSKKTSKGLDGMGGAAGAAVAGLKSMTKAGLAFIATPIGLVIAGIGVAVLAVKSAFTSSEAGQNKFNKLMGVLGSLLGNLTDKLSDFGEAIISAFENPREAIESFVTLIKDNIINRFEGLLELIPQLGKAVSALFRGDFVEAGQIAIDATAKVAFGIENLTDKIREATEATADFMAELEREAKIAGQIADKRAKADKIERDLLVERAKADRKIVELRAKAARQDLFTLEERKQALIEASEINEEITNKEIIAAQLRSDAITAENKLSKSNKESLKEEEQAKAAVIRLETKKLNLQKRLGTELSTINLQQAAAAAKEEEIANKKAAKEEEIANKKNELLAASGRRAIEVELELKALRAEVGLEDPNATVEQIQASFDAKKEVENSLFALELEENQTKFDNGIILEEERNNQKALIEFKHQKNIQKINADSIGKISKKEGDAAKQKASNEKAAAMGTIGVAGDVLSAVSGLLAEGSAEAKALAIGAATMSGIQGVQAAYSSAAAIPITGPALAPIAAAAAGLVAVANIRKIASTKTGSKSGGGASGSSNFTPPTVASAPSLNDETLFTNGVDSGEDALGVGSGAGINQIKAIVVESDITDAQNTISGIEESAEIG